ESAVLRRHAQGRTVHSGEVYRGQGRKTRLVRVQAYAYAAVLRRYAQEPLNRTRGRVSRRFKSARWNRRIRRCSSRGGSGLIYRAGVDQSLDGRADVPAGPVGLSEQLV